MDKEQLEFFRALRAMAFLEALEMQAEILKRLAAACCPESPRSSAERKRLINLATENCKDETVLQWLRENSESGTFRKLSDMFDFLKSKIDEEEKKNHDDTVDIIFVAHGSIRDSMIPASCLLPLPTITDLVLYSPWNCATTPEVTYGIATGKMRPEHRIFYRDFPLPFVFHSVTVVYKQQPPNLPDCWNSLKKVGGRMIPNIIVSPLRPYDGVWERFKSLSTKYGPPGRNHIVIPFILPGESESVPFSVVALALSLVLLSSRFKATVHLDTCLSDKSTGQKSDRKYLQEQYYCTEDNTGMTCSPDAFDVNWEMLKRLINLATENCKDETVLQWLRENSESGTFRKLSDMFDFLKSKIDEEEKKNHSDTVDIIFVAHGSIRDSMIPAKCLLPLPTITDLVLYSPWNCATTPDVTYGIATGKMRPQHRVFYRRKEKGDKIPLDKYQPLNLPNYWNSLKKAGGRKIPNIIVSPLQEIDGTWERFKSLSTKYGPPGRNRIVIPFILPGERESVPFSVVALALSLVLLSSRFKVTVHLDTCLSDVSTGQKSDRKYLQEQYYCTEDNTVMTCSPDAFDVNWWDRFKSLFS
ncbi:uncharacterized protein LOC102079504 isoform X2 [Oreochromis niloticus]|uniref:uncharacterized protein LOC102079504 isoform X2 n=1 Tax=Oreochromis niloticus TaxID=8128 RepID=UPI0009045FD1|nr:uncharacterized protein LOC102079504 isoform X2 [Oreochromis niloticus]XP_019218909.1 uncharacterized protein LOC102079504 isoform X2 [Oreochromis niloticus]XP_025757089.1 uncharacterized protein LOC102079504 isoform X2 [Oreochromis niloticus]